MDTLLRPTETTPRPQSDGMQVTFETPSPTSIHTPVTTPLATNHTPHKTPGWSTSKKGRTAGRYSISPRYVLKHGFHVYVSDIDGWRDIER